MRKKQKTQKKKKIRRTCGRHPFFSLSVGDSRETELLKKELLKIHFGYSSYSFRFSIFCPFRFPVHDSTIFFHFTLESVQTERSFPVKIIFPDFFGNPSTSLWVRTPHNLLPLIHLTRPSSFVPLSFFVNACLVHSISKNA